MERKQQDDKLELIARNLAGIADSFEAARLMEWIGSSQDNRQYFEQIRIIWDASDKHTGPNRVDTKRALEKVFIRIHKRTLIKNIWYHWQKIAAVILIPLVIGTLLWIYLSSHQTRTLNYDVYNEIHALYGTRSSIQLSDSTLVWLNSGSSLRYPLKFSKKNRQVFLRGEAYFEVKSDVSRPFTVETPTLNVKATGTKFNVREYDLNPVTEVTLVSGKVFVNESSKKNVPQLISELNPNQHLFYNRQTKMKYITKEDSYRFISWKDGKLVFRNEPLSEVVNKISLMFNVDIELRGKELQDYRYRATFEDESLGEMLKLLKLSSPIDFKEIEREPLPDGSFPKKKVIIFQAKRIKNNESINY